MTAAVPAAAPRAPRGSWPWLLALLAAFLLAFAWLRSRSTFLAIERQAPAARELAAAHGLRAAEALALRDLVGLAAPDDRWRAAAAEFAAQRAALGDPLAAVAVAGHAASARAALRAAGGDPQRAWAQCRGEPWALAGLRFLALRDRFAARRPGRD